jgi:RNA polymerase sigma factor (sigma-70 family)
VTTARRSVLPDCSCPAGTGRELRLSHASHPSPNEKTSPIQSPEQSDAYDATGTKNAAESVDDDRRLADFYRQYWGELYAYLRRTFGAGPPDPEDVAQSAFTQLAAHRDWRALEHARAFLFRVAHNLVMDYHRSEAVRSRFVKERASDNEHSDDLHAERVLSAKEQLSIIETTLSSMEPRRRTVFVMNRIHELSFAEIARRLKMPQTTVKRHVSAAVVDCMRALRDRGFKDERPWR